MVIRFGHGGAITSARPEGSKPCLAAPLHSVEAMSSTPSIAKIAALVSNSALANVLTVLLDGRALTATELAFAAHVSPQTTSGHLANSENKRRADWSSDRLFCASSRSAVRRSDRRVRLIRSSIIIGVC
jgi:hypothetical protein